MSFFPSKPGSPQDPNAVVPLSRELIESAMKEREWRYSVDSDGDVGGMWDNNPFYFFIRGKQDEILYVQARWRRELPIEKRAEVIDVIDQWHMEHYWPKGYTRVDDSGKLWVYAEHVVDFETGATQGLVSQTIRCAVATACQLFDHIDERFPLAV